MIFQLPKKSSNIILLKDKFQEGSQVEGITIEKTRALSDLWSDKKFDLNYNNTKIHFVYQDTDPRNIHPLKALENGEFLEWQCFQRRKNFECDFVLSIIKLPEKNKWLFAGIYQVIHRPTEKVFKSPFEHEAFYVYVMELLSIKKEQVGKIVIDYKKMGYGSYLWAKKEIIERIAVDKILQNPHRIK